MSAYQATDWQTPLLQAAQQIVSPARKRLERVPGATAQPPPPPPPVYAPPAEIAFEVHGTTDADGSDSAARR